MMGRRNSSTSRPRRPSSRAKAKGSAYHGSSAARYGDVEKGPTAGGASFAMSMMGGGGGGGGGGYGVSAIELEKTLKKALKTQRDTEVKLQLELQKGVQLNGTSSRLLQENEMLKSQVEDIRGRLLEAKLQNVKLKTELQSRREAVEGGFVAR